MTITNTGRVGSNTLTPAGLLEVRNSGTQYLLYGTTGNLEVYGAENATSGTFIRLGAFYYSPAIYSNNVLNLVSDNNNDIIFKHGISEKMRIKANGNVGIGINPSYKLEVDGNIKGDNLFLGADGQAPKIDIFFKDHKDGNVWDTKIEIGKSNQFTLSPAFPPSGSYGMNVQANSDGLFVGLETYDSGSNWRPLLKWGDDLYDTPFTIHSYIGNHKWEFGTDGRLVVPNIIRGAPGTVCKIHILPFTDSDTINISGNSYQNVVSKTFTKTAGTDIFAEVKINYTISGTLVDRFEARLNFSTLFTVNGDGHAIVYTGLGGGGHRSGGINDVFVYSDGAGVSLSGTQGVYLQARRDGADDTISFKQGMFKVTEIWA